MAASTTRKRKPVAKVTYLPASVAPFNSMSSEALILHGELGEAQSIEAGLEFLRRKGNTRRRKLADAKAAA